MKMTFYLDEEETEKFNNWKMNLQEVPEEDLDVFGKDYLYTFKFKPTGLGIVKIVEREYDGAEINLTDYDEW